jgi:hypothetical protein
MSIVAYSTTKRAVIVIGLYIALVSLAGIAFYWMRQGVAENSPVRYAYALCGPALSLFTHMSYFLFGLQSLLLLPWLALGVARPQMKWISGIGFCLCWLGIGWYMYDLF